MPKKILIVDDNPNMSSLLSEMLEVFDYESVRASDGEEALLELQQGGISMVITDMRMPKMTGLELVDEVKTRFPKLPTKVTINRSNCCWMPERVLIIDWLVD